LYGGAGGLSPGAECEGVALVALDVAWCIKVVILARRDVLLGQQVSDVETDDLDGIVVSCSSIDALQESWNKTKVSSAHKSYEASERPDCNTTPEEAVESPFEDFEVALACQWLN
jgi:hypothetical protein